MAIRTFFLVSLVLLGMSGTALSQQKKDEPTATEILSQAMEMLQQKNYDDAIDMMFSYLTAVEDSKMPRVLEIAQDARYKLATLLISRNRKGEAIPVLEDYVATQPAKHVRKARKMLVACYFDEKKYTECIPAVTNALYFNEHPVEVKKERKSAMDRDVENQLLEEGKEEEPDLPYSQEELEMLHFTMAESFFNLGTAELDKTGSTVEKANEFFQACLEPFTYVSERTKDEQRKGYSIMQMINALIHVQSFDRIIAWVPELYKTPARFDIRVNLALLNAAVALFEAGEYDSALPLYRMILPREQVIEFQEQKLREMKIKAGLPPEYGEDWTPDEALLFGQADADRQAKDESLSMVAQSSTVTIVEEEETVVDDTIVPSEITELSNLLKILKDMAPYETYVDFQTAQLYKNVLRPWEAVTFFDKVYEEDKDGEIGQRSVYEAAALLIDELDKFDDAKARAYRYLETHHEGTFPRLVAYVLTRHCQRVRAWKTLQELSPYLASMTRTDDVEINKYDAELNFMQGVAQLMLQQYTNAVERFEYVNKEFAGTTQEANSLFWCGFSYLCLDQHQDAYDCFERYTREFSDLKPEESLLDEAYYQGGICLFGLDRLDEAKERFAYVIDTFGTNSTVYPDSCNMRGDILGSLGGDDLDRAVADYKNAFKYATKASQATYATFKMCDIFKADEAHYGLDYITEAVNLYLAKWGDEGADIAKALFWLGRTEIQRARYEAAAESYMQAVLDYGDNLRQDGVDLMIPELVKICSVFLDEAQQEMVKNRLRIAMESTESEVLRLRLRVVLAKFDNTELELGKQLIKELPDLENASPPVLAAICEASFAEKDYSRSEEMLRTFKYKFEDSDYMRSAYKLRAAGQYATGDLTGALNTVIAAQEEYGTDSSSSWAQLLKADLLLAQANVFNSDKPLTEDQLDEESKALLLMAKGGLEAVNEQIAEAQAKPADAQAQNKLKQLQADKSKLVKRIADLQEALQDDIGEPAVRALLTRCKLEDSREENKNVMGVPEWRGKPYAQATYQLGQVEEAAGNLIDAHGYYQRVYYLYAGQGDWGPKGYLAAANVLKKLSEDPSLSAEDRASYETARVSTLKAMLLDKYANKSPEVATARELLGPSGVAEVETIINSGLNTNIVVTVENKKANPEGSEPSEGTGDTAGKGDA